MANIYGVDIGTSNFKMCCKDKKDILNEKNIIAIANKKDLLAFGDEAYEMYEKAPENIEVSFPVKFGVIADIENMQTLLLSFFNKINGDKKAPGNTDFYIAVPTDVTEVEKRAVEEATRQAGAREVYIIEEPIAAAIGAGIDVSQPNGNMVIDIGGGTADVAVISLGGAVVSESIKIGGDKFDEAIVRYMKKQHNLLIGERTAEKIKIEIGCAYKREEEKTMRVTGRNLITGLPYAIEVSSSEMLEALDECVEQIVVTAHVVQEKTPPELAADISDRGIIMTGGGSLLYGLDKRIEERTGIKVIVANEPLSCVAAGTGKALSSIDLLKSGGTFNKK